MKRQAIILPILFSAGMMMLTSCSSDVKKSMGLQQESPDEFRVIAAPPLSVPPDFNLRPPRTGGKEQAEPSDVQAEQALYGANGRQSAPLHQGATSPSRGESALMGKTGESDPQIRQALESDNQPAQTAGTPEAEKPGFFKKLLSSSQKKEEPVVNADAEKKRIEDNKKSGKPVTEGETPTVTEQKSVLQQLME